MVVIYKMFALFALVTGAVFVSPSAASTDPCFESKNQGSVNCRQYNYDKLHAYFRDASHIEHKVIIKRVLSKSTGKLLHANYDFEIQCHTGLSCASSDAMAESALWAFRNAIVENSLYQIIYHACDPSRELCCDESACQVPAGVAEPQDTNPTVQRRNPRDRREDRTLEKIESVTNIMDNVARNSRNAFDFKEEVITNVVRDMPSFAYTEVNSGSYTLCKLQSSGRCERINGRMLDSGESGYAEFSHNYGQDTNKQLSDFLWEFFITERQMTCSQSMRCSADLCTVIYQCQVR